MSHWFDSRVWPEGCILSSTARGKTIPKYMIVVGTKPRTLACLKEFLGYPLYSVPEASPADNTDVIIPGELT